MCALRLRGQPSKPPCSCPSLPLPRTVMKQLVPSSSGISMPSAVMKVKGTAGCLVPWASTYSHPRPGRAALRRCASVTHLYCTAQTDSTGGIKRLNSAAVELREGEGRLEGREIKRDGHMQPVWAWRIKAACTPTVEAADGARGSQPAEDVAERAAQDKRDKRSERSRGILVRTRCICIDDSVMQPTP